MSETQKPEKTPQSLVTESLLKKTLKTDKGDDAELISYEVKDFTSKGDNYACVVTSALVRYRQGDQKEKEVSYVAKCNPCRKQEIFDSVTIMAFSKEAAFYHKIVPLINVELEAVGQEPLRLPECYVNHEVEGEQVLMMRDLRVDGFKMFDRKKGMDKAHATLVVRELARLHAASVVAQDKMSEPIEDTHDFLMEDFDTLEMPDGKKIFEIVFASNLTNGAKMAEKIGGYEKVAEWLNSKSKEGLSMFVDCIRSKNEPFNVVCHGDCWNNNILFKYDEAGKPIDVRLIDLQICRKATPATDLNYFMYTSLNGPERKENLQSFLEIYYDTFLQVLSRAGKTMPFSLEELKKEYHRMNLFGFLMALMIVPLVVAEASEVMDFDEFGEDVEESMKGYEEKMLAQLDTNPLLQPRLLATYDEMLEYGVI
ncbi:uncharacterized protein LOC123506551 isoform X2 [Portunus trituberculatus]|uniref:uncharacterized protein LOC123506551 isoform X1 n=1 Tax=Portunus trituberculatus TaxID=210409 RepID=UPI001E1CE344|nr:uncharacterized protein LOC123506551 isoform X1 [Portunus trituberculatus]XP_045114677.1 uncharacterized protein LOC123506551 isoform X2 [Portunus trituberculatus]